jgi:hypothetical protein
VSRCPLCRTVHRPYILPAGGPLGTDSEDVLPMKHGGRFQRQFDKLQHFLPPRFADWLAWLRRPQAKPVRIPLGIFFILGGIFSFLPILGIWMLPLGILLLAIDLPFLQGPTGTAFVRVRRWWQQRKRRNRDKAAHN